MNARSNSNFTGQKESEGEWYISYNQQVKGEWERMTEIKESL